ncbi:MAG: GNAT family N-acetyltransferase [Chloroflexaceae bacterium]|nr:GNAT family N-acetyltransferase [Chloroflexaceae bacterium]
MRDRSVCVCGKPAGDPGLYLFAVLADQRQARIARLLVDLSARRQGIGSALLRTARLWAHNTGCMALQGHVPLRNVPGIRFYQHRGLSICGLIERFYPTLEDALLLMQPL